MSAAPRLWLDEARQALAGESDGLVVVPRRDGAPAVAFLVQLGESPSPRWVLPLQLGRTAVCRNASFGDFEIPPGTPPFVEGAQWLVRCDAGRAARVCDAASTNGGFVVPARVPADDDERGALRGAQGKTSPERIEMPHPSRVPNASVELREGDALIGCYAAFAFGWV